jgi:hypothetical protein
MASAAHSSFSGAGHYRIVVVGQLDESYSSRLGGMTVMTSSEGEGVPVTTLTGTLKDQSQLSGVLNTLYELHMSIVSVQFLKGGRQ